MQDIKQRVALTSIAASGGTVSRCAQKKTGSPAPPFASSRQ
jgi:hypothetical protein